jgi:hypothetical protein
MPAHQAAASPRQNFGRRVYTFTQWCEKNGLTERTGRRILASGDGPKITQLSERRIGIREDHDLAWLDSRVR